METDRNHATIMRQIRALLNLTVGRGATEEEASAAASKVQELLLKYQLTMGEVHEAKNPVVEEFRAQKSRREERWRAALFAVVARTYLCRAMRDFVEDETRYRLFGRRANVEIALAVYDYLLGAVKRIARVECRGQKASFRNAFCHGMVYRLGQRMRDSRKHFKEEAPEGTALALLSLEQREEIAISCYFRENRIDSRPGRPFGWVSSEAFDAGRAAAEGVNLDAQVKGGREPLAIGASRERGEL
jgi:hypothetical protein